MTVISPGGDFLELILNWYKNKFLAGNIPVIKSPLFFLKGKRRRGEGRRGGERMREGTVTHVPRCARSHQNASKFVG